MLTIHNHPCVLAYSPNPHVSCGSSTLHCREADITGIKALVLESDQVWVCGRLQRHKVWSPGPVQPAHQLSWGCSC